MGAPCVPGPGWRSRRGRWPPRGHHGFRLRSGGCRTKARQAPRPWRVYEVTCPDCGKAPGARCASPSGGVHRSRVDLARENTRKGLPRS
ncbi:zinc finger domain-containing protein [Streptomyces antimycoticus]